VLSSTRDWRSHRPAAAKWQESVPGSGRAGEYAPPGAERTAPDLLTLHGVGAGTAATLLVTAGDNPGRLRSEAAWAHLCGTAPIPASSGRVTRYRHGRGGDRQANCALWGIVITRLRNDPRTQAYMTRRLAEGRCKPEVIRILKRYVAREVYHHLPRP
jgi:transposase